MLSFRRYRKDLQKRLFSRQKLSFCHFSVGKLLAACYCHHVRVKPVKTSRTRRPWCVVTPARMSASGKRVYSYFAKRAQADAFAAQLNDTAAQAGCLAMAITNEALRDAASALAILRPAGLTLTQAAHMALASSGTCQTLPAEGAGAREKENASTPPALGITLAELLSEYDASHSHQAARTRSARISALNTLFRRNPGLSDTAAAALTAADLRHCLDTAWPEAATAWNTAHKHLAALYAYAIKHSHCTSSPMLAIDTRHADEQEIRALTPAELRALFAACRPALPGERVHGESACRTLNGRLANIDTSACAAYIALGAFAGIRPEEIKRLRWQDIDLEDSIVTVRAANSKTGGARHIDLHPTLRAWLLRARPADAAPTDTIIPASDLTNRLKAVRIRAGYGASNPWPQDALRHSYATYYLKHGGNVNRLQLHMGHRSAQLLYTRYTNMIGVTRKSAAEWWTITPEKNP